MMKRMALIIIIVKILLIIIHIYLISRLMRYTQGLANAAGRGQRMNFFQ